MIIDINPVAFYIPIPLIGWWPVYWYGISWLIAILAINYAAKVYAPNSGLINKKIIDDFIFYGVLGAIIGGRFGYVLFYNFNYYLENLAEILMLWKGGMSFHGGVIGVFIATYYFSIKNKINIFIFLDLISLSAPIGIFLGRISNFINSELIGKETNVFWGVIFEKKDNLLRHPSQLYEAMLEGVVLFILLNLINKKYNNLSNGIISSLFLIFYSLFRFLIEFFRVPDEQLGYIILSLTMGQIISFIFFIVGIYLITTKYEIKSKN